MAAAKRARTASGAFAGALTGGTGDVKPQYLTVKTERASGLNTYIINQFALPVARIGAVRDRATVVELLRVDWYEGLHDTGDGNHLEWAFLSTVTDRTDGETSDANSSSVDAANPLTLAMVARNHFILTTGGHMAVWPQSVDLTDGAGNGVLVATDRLTIVYGNSGGNSVSQGIAKILYRLVNVGIAEYVGIVQAQQ